MGLSDGAGSDVSISTGNDWSCSYRGEKFLVRRKLIRHAALQNGTPPNWVKKETWLWMGLVATNICLGALLLSLCITPW